MDHTQHQQASPEPGCDHLWFSDLVLPPASLCHLTHELLQQSPASFGSSPLPHFHSFRLYGTAPSLEAAPEADEAYPGVGELSVHRCSPSGLLCLFTVSPTNPPPPFLPSSLKDLPQEALGREVERLPFRAACLISHNAIALASLQGPQQTPPPSPHPLGLASRSPLSLPSSLSSTLPLEPQNYRLLI